MKLTAEQQAIIDCPPQGTIRILSFAGAAKTTTLENYARRWAMPSLYLTFNTEMAKEARPRFPATCETRTPHSYAHRALDIRKRGAGGRLIPKLRPEHLAPYEMHLDGVPGMTDHQVKTAVIRTIERFSMSAGPEFLPEHCAARTQRQRLAIRRMAAAVAGDLFRIFDHDGPITHDVYLKLFELTGRIAGPRYLLLDEGQDWSPVLISIVAKSGLPAIIAGDPWQSIYRFRGAVDAMETFDGPILTLSQSWRFGEAIARIGNKILGYTSKPPKLPIRGNPALDTSVHRYAGRVKTGSGTAVLARTNARLFDSLANLSIPFHYVGRLNELTRQLLSAYALRKGMLSEVYDESVQRFASWGALDHAAETGDNEAKRLRDIVLKYGDQLPPLLERLEGFHRADENKAELVVGTAHSAKGREWPIVYVLDDFPIPAELQAERIKNPHKAVELDQELHLTYVCISRAKEQLHLAPELYEALA